MRVAKPNQPSQSGVALLTTILLMLLMSSLLVGFVLLINSGQKLSSTDNDYGKAFYAAEAGLEKLTADLGTLFDANYAPPTAQVTALQNNPPVLSGITYVNADGSSGYTITSPNPVDSNGNYLPTVTTIQSGAYQGMTALATPYVMNVTAHTTMGSEVKLQRTTQTVGIPMFQFGVFCDTDCDFFAGPNFNFGGRAHTNGNWWLASGSTLTMSDRVTAYKDVIRYTLENGHLTSSGYTGTVNIYNGSGTRALGTSEGSVQQGLSPAAQNSNWPSISLGSSNYAGNLRNGAGSAFPANSTGANQLQLGIVTLGGGTTQSIDVIRRPVLGESSSVTQERYFAQASMKILLSDNPADITGGAGGLPCTSSTAPYNLYNLTTMNVANAQTAAIKAGLQAKGETFVPLAVSGANAITVPNPFPGSYSSANGYWTTPNNPTITGYIKIEIQTPPYNACNWTDVTAEVLGYGYVGKNANPTGVTVPPLLPALPAAAVGSLTAGQPGADACADGHAQAIIRLERIRDNPINPANPLVPAANLCGVTGTTIDNSTTGVNFWPNVFFDAREGFLRDSAPAGSVGTIPYSSMPTLGGVMQYVEIDVKNAARYLSGLSGGSGHNSYDSSNAPNDYVIYISDRRGNYYSSGVPFAGAWPPLSPSTNETGEYGFVDFVNPGDTNGCPNKSVDTGENLNGTGDYYTYGQDPTHTLQVYNAVSPWLGGYGTTNGIYNPTPNVANAWAPPPYAANGGPNNCGVTTPSVIWPGTLVVHAAEARENPNFLFRRAVKLVNGKDLIDNLSVCPGNVTCGLTIASENPVYIQGDYNCPSCAGNSFDGRSVGASVIGDAVYVLSNNFNDVNTFINPYSQALRVATTTYYRAAVVGGLTVPFPQPTAWASAQDFGTDGGIHNFLRYIENWGGQTVNYSGSLVGLYTSRQAVGTFKCCTTVYSAPSRNYSFDTNFLDPSLLPPRTPLFRDVNTTGFTQLLSPTQ